MKQSSAAQLEIDFEATESTFSSANSGSVGNAPRAFYSTEVADPFPSFHKPGGGAVFAATARIAGRMNAASISSDEFNALLKERQLLLDKNFAGTMTPREANRLTYIRWTLDRIEDAQSGWKLDQLESSALRYEQMLEALLSLQKDLMRRAGRRTR